MMSFKWNDQAQGEVEIIQNDKENNTLCESRKLEIQCFCVRELDLFIMEARSLPNLHAKGKIDRL